MQRVGAVLWPHFPCLQVYGANTNVGKTIVSTLLCHAWSKKRTTYYLKPVSTGSLEDADNRYVITISLLSTSSSKHHFSPLFQYAILRILVMRVCGMKVAYL
jgi:dethiobiotin synthetase